MRDLIEDGHSAVAGGVMLIGVGALLLSSWWWPGIMLMVGAAIDLVLRGHPPPAPGTFLFRIPLTAFVTECVRVPLEAAGALVLIGLGLTAVIHTVTRRAP